MKTICAHDVTGNPLPTFSNHVDIWFIPTVSRKITVNFMEVGNPNT